MARKKATKNYPRTASEPPSHLTPDAIEAWRAIVANAGNPLQPPDYLLVEVCASWFARWRMLEHELQTAPAEDQYKLSILCAAASKAFVLASQKLALGPADRAKLSKIAPPPLPKRPSPFERLESLCIKKNDGYGNKPPKA